MTDGKTLIDTVDAPKLKPCPFCGAAPHRMLSKVKHDQLHGDAYQDTIIRCPHRCAEMEGSLDAVAERWNTRADISQAAVEALEAKLAKAVEALDDLISTYVWVREDEYERGWGEMSNAVHEATFVQMELTGGKDD